MIIIFSVCSFVPLVERLSVVHSSVTNSFSFLCLFGFHVPNSFVVVEYENKVELKVRRTSDRNWRSKSDQRRGDLKGGWKRSRGISGGREGVGR